MFIWSQWCAWSLDFRRKVATAPIFLVAKPQLPVAKFDYAPGFFEPCLSHRSSNAECVILIPVFFFTRTDLSNCFLAVPPHRSHSKDLSTEQFRWFLPRSFWRIHENKTYGTEINEWYPINWAFLNAFLRTRTNLAIRQINLQRLHMLCPAPSRSEQTNKYPESKARNISVWSKMSIWIFMTCTKFQQLDSIPHIFLHMLDLYPVQYRGYCFKTVFGLEAKKNSDHRDIFDFH